MAATTTMETATNEDFTGEFLDSKQQGQDDDIRQWADSFMGIEEPAAVAEEPVAPSVKKDEKAPLRTGTWETITEIAFGEPIVAGINKAVSNTVALGEDIDNFFLSKGIDMPVLQIADPKTGEFKLDVVKRSEFNKQLEEAGVKNKLTQFVESETVGGKMVEDITAFIAGFVGAGKFIKAPQAAGKAVKTAVDIGKGALSDFLVFEGSEGNLSDLIQEHEALRNPVNEYLAGDEDDTELEGRFKTSLEGLGLGAMVEPFIKTVKALKNANVARVEKAKLEKTMEEAKKLAEVEPQIQKLSLGDEAAPEFEFVSAEGKPFQGGSRFAPDEAALNINMARIDTSDDVKMVIENVGKKYAGSINEARREQITLEETSKLADELGMSVERLLDRRKGQAFNAEELLASRRILLSSAEQMTSFARSIAQKGADASPAELVKLRRLIAQHKAIQEQVSGATAEAGRALSQFRIVAKSAKEQEQLINEALNSSGGIEVAREQMLALANLADPKQINVAVSQMSRATTKEMVYEAWINGLLTNPTTHVANILGNVITLSMQPMERKVASMIGQIAGDPQIPSGEASAQMFGAINSIMDAFRVASHTFKTGIPASQTQKIEQLQRTNITGANVEAALQRSFIGRGKKRLTGKDLEMGGTFARGVDFVGEYVARAPGRLLSTSDDFFQLIGYRMELHAQAYRQAAAEGLQGEALAARVNDIVANPPENIHSAAVDARHYATFTSELGTTGQAVSKALSTVPGGRVIMPFMKTPFNILAYAMERQPLAPVTPIIGKQIREDIMAGGARRDMAMAKIVTGSWVMAAASQFAMAGYITGSGPSNPQARAIWNEQYQPYSIRIGDTWYAYNRFDPLAVTIANAADLTQVIGELEEADAMVVATQSVLSVAQNMISKNYMRGIANLFDALGSARVDPDADNKQALMVIQNIISSAVPSGVSAVARINDPVMRSTYDPNGFRETLNRVQARLPGWSKDLFPRRNLFGEPIVLGGGLGPDIMSPIYTNEIKADPVVDELVRIGVPLRMPSKKLDGVDLTAAEYDRLMVLMGEIKADGLTLKQQLGKFMKSADYKNRLSDGPDGGKSDYVQMITNKYKQAATATLMQESIGNPEGIAARVNERKRKMKLQAFNLGE